ncbi:hypothetical protein HanIR_Chr09g0419781 [Helianthus annuus]|nr:hypothetical protein HanIR_Chr09g0419781 [Helianthus annuus]
MREQKKRSADNRSLSSGTQFQTIPMNILLLLLLFFKLGFSEGSLSFAIFVADGETKEKKMQRECVFV